MEKKDFCYLPVTIEGDMVRVNQFPDCVYQKEDVELKHLDNEATVIMCEIIDYNDDGSYNFILPPVSE